MTDIYEVIQTASDQHVRTLLRLLCDSDYNIKSRTAEFHGMIENLQPTVTTSSSLLINNHNHNHNSHNNHNDSTCCSISSDRKRKRDPLEIFYCVNCKECFMDEENDDEACSYHPGEFDPDRDDFFADHDDEVHGRLDDEEMFATYPQGKLKSSGSDDDDEEEEEEVEEGEEEEEQANSGRRENGEGGTDDNKENSNEKDGVN
ncbi:hypothetical protein TWF970_006994 [Orbilia oligospora]|uniref:C2H2-type domain-containing protein n=1 Tax=Orbilia oligospora TaxID=2813651 RepID=A0A7C8R8S7_ORBOL|nr:hypothetical protein TWF970_006994 [Orbilia oligospora]